MFNMSQKSHVISDINNLASKGIQDQQTRSKIPVASHRLSPKTPSPRPKTGPVASPARGPPSSPSKGRDKHVKASASLTSTVNEEPRGWAMWTFNTLKKVVYEAKGAASKPVVDYIMKHLRGTKLIFVVGPSGTGKTTILQELTGLDLKVGGTMKSGTLKYSVCPAVIDGEQYLFVDTAGFGASDIDDMANFRNIIDCVEALGSFVTFHGLIFVYGGISDRLMQPDSRTMNWVQCFCGPQFYRNITIITTKWDYWSEGVIDEKYGRLECLKDQGFKPLLEPKDPYHGAQLYHHGLKVVNKSSRISINVLSKLTNSAGRSKEIQNLIRKRYTETESAKLQIIQELDKGIPWDETEAAKCLKSDSLGATICIQNDRAVLNVKDAPGEAGSASTSRSPPAKSSSESHEDAEDQKDAKQPAASKSTDSPPKIKPHKSSLPKTQEKEPMSFAERILIWIEIAKQASAFFAEARKMAEQKRAGKPRWGAWGELKDWWYGPPKKH